MSGCVLDLFDKGLKRVEELHLHQCQNGVFESAYTKDGFKIQAVCAIGVLLLGAHPEIMTETLKPEEGYGLGAEVHDLSITDELFEACPVLNQHQVTHHEATMSAYSYLWKLNDGWFGLAASFSEVRRWIQEQRL